MADAFDRLTEALSDRYTIERELGAGGMATVYLARDLKHERQVAVKVLRPELAAAIGAERFLREIKIAANLNHPHILPLHDSGEADGFLFYVMPYVEGESLRERLDRDKQLPVSDALKFAGEVADALGSAHRHNLIHRDIKPENILLEEGHAVVADFGVARAIFETDETRLTETGIALGTPAYLSPEQATGERDLDGRSDIYALGCVLFEMLAGRAPFVGPTVESVVHQHIASDPPSVTELRPALPETIVRTVSKALAKAPADRHQEAEELGAELTAEQVSISAPTVTEKPAITVGILAAFGSVFLVAVVALGLWLWSWLSDGSGEDIPVLAVLPAEQIGSAEDQTLGEGLVLEAHSRLTGLSGLKVIAYNSTRQFKDSVVSNQEVGRALGADYLLRTTIQWQRPAGQTARVLVVAALVNTSNDTEEWSERYSEELSDIYSVQADVAEQVVDALGVRILQSESISVVDVPTDNQVAYRYYMRGKAHLARPTQSDRHQAVEMFARAVESDSLFALARAYLSISLSLRSWFSTTTREQDTTEARREAEAALQVNPDLAEAHWAMGEYHYRSNRDYAAALREFDLAKSSRPNDPEIVYSIGVIERRQGKWEETVQNLTRAVELDPRSQRKVYALGQTLVYLRQYSKAEPYLDQAIALTPDIPRTYLFKSLVHILRDGSLEAGAAVLQEAPAGVATWVMTNGSEWRSYLLLRLYACGFAGPLESYVAGQASGEFLVRAHLANCENQADLTMAYYDSLRLANESAAVLMELPTTGSGLGPSTSSSYLSIAYAHLGRMDDAIRTGWQAAEFIPYSEHPWDGWHPIAYLVEVYIMAGENERAIEQLDFLLSIPSPLSAALLRVDPLYDPLRDNPRFQALLERYGH